jgi:hypothetical protein
VLREVFGFERFRGQQLAMIKQVIADADAVVLMSTGGAAPGGFPPMPRRLIIRNTTRRSRFVTGAAGRYGM